MNTEQKAAVKEIIEAQNSAFLALSRLKDCFDKNEEICYTIDADDESLTGAEQDMIGKLYGCYEAFVDDLHE